MKKQGMKSKENSKKTRNWNNGSKSRGDQSEKLTVNRLGIRFEQQRQLEANSRPEDGLL